MEKQKMPKGMKIILVWLYLGFVGGLITLVMNGGYPTGVSFWGIPYIALSMLSFAINLFLIVSIHTRKW